MAYKVIILYQLYMPSYFLGTFTEYPYKDINKINSYLCIVNHARQTYPYGAVDH